MKTLYYRFPTLYELAFKFPPQGYWRWKSYSSLLNHIQHSVFSIQHSDKHEARSTKHEKGIEVGCGSGILSRTLVESFPNLSLTSVDLSPQMIQYAKRSNGHPRVQFLHGDFFEISGTYDLFVSAYAWVYFSLGESVEKLKTLLCPSGRFFILNVGKTPFTQIHSTFLRKIHRKPIYLHQPKTFQIALQKRGFNVHWHLIDSFEGSYLIYGKKME